MLQRVAVCFAVSCFLVAFIFPTQTKGDFIGSVTNEKAKEKPAWSSKFLDFALRKLSLSNGGEKTDPDKPQNRTKRLSSYRRAKARDMRPIYPYRYVIRPAMSRYTVLHPEDEVNEMPTRRNSLYRSLGRYFRVPVGRSRGADLVPRSMNDPPGLDPQLIQSAYEKRAFWNPIGDQTFSNTDQLDLGSPDHSYRTITEKEAMTVDPEKLLLQAIARKASLSNSRRRSSNPLDLANEELSKEGFGPLLSEAGLSPGLNAEDEHSNARQRSYPAEDDTPPAYPYQYRSALKQGYQLPFRKESISMPLMPPDMFPDPRQRYLSSPDDTPMAPAEGSMYPENPPADVPDRPERTMDASPDGFPAANQDPAPTDSLLGIESRDRAFFPPPRTVDLTDRPPDPRDEAMVKNDYNSLLPGSQDEDQPMPALQQMFPPMDQGPDQDIDNQPEVKQDEPMPMEMPASRSYFPQPYGMDPTAAAQQVPQDTSDYAARQQNLAQQLLKDYYFRAMQYRQFANQANAAAQLQQSQATTLRRRMLQPIAAVPVVMAVAPQGSIIPGNLMSSLFPTKPQEKPSGAATQPKASNASVSSRSGPMLTFTPLSDDSDKKDLTDHKELVSNSINLNGKKSNDIKPDAYKMNTSQQGVPLNVQKAIHDILTDSLKEGKLTTTQSDEIENKVSSIFKQNRNNGTHLLPPNTTSVTNTSAMDSVSKAGTPALDGKKDQAVSDSSGFSSCKDQISECQKFKEGGVCPFMDTFMEGMCDKTCGSCQLDYIDSGGTSQSSKADKDSEIGRARWKQTQKQASKKTIGEECQDNNEDGCDKHEKSFQIPDGSSMHLSFDSMASETVVDDDSGNGNKGVLLKGAKLSNRKLGTCGKAAEINGGDVSWSGKEFAKKPVDAVTLGMWVKVKKSGNINWFANGDQGKTFYLSTQGTVVPAKVWTHVAGTYDSKSGLSRVYINGDLVQETQQTKGEKLMQDWLVNGIGKSFGDDSIHYVDEVYIYAKALSPSEVHALYKQCQFNRMVIHYGFQRGNTSVIKDQSGLQNDAILLGGAQAKDDCDRCGTCLDMTDGPDPTLKIERISLKNLPTTGVSVALWISLNSTEGIHDLFVTQGRLDGSGYHLQVVDGQLRWRIGADNGESIFDYETPTIVVPEALWSHVIATFNAQSGEVRIFVNGVSKLNKVVEKSKRKLLPQDWESEAKIGGKNFLGYMDEFLLYNWDLDASEALYVRHYCADHPKLVRFTVRVPLTRRNMINNKKAAQWQKRSFVTKPTETRLKHVTSPKHQKSRL